MKNGRDELSLMPCTEPNKVKTTLRKRYIIYICTHTDTHIYINVLFWVKSKALFMFMFNVMFMFVMLC